MKSRRSAVQRDPNDVDSFDYSSLSVDFAKMSRPAKRALITAGIRTPRELSRRTLKEIGELHGMGPGSFSLMTKVLRKHGLKFKAPVKKESLFELWAAKQSPKHKKLITLLRKLVKKTAPTLVESFKWMNGCWLGKEWPVIFLHAEKDHLQFGFFGGASLSDPKSLLRGEGKYVRHIRVSKPSDIDSAAFARLIRQAVRQERSG